MLAESNKPNLLHQLEEVQMYSELPPDPYFVYRWDNFEGFDNPYRVREQAAQRLHLELKYHYDCKYVDEEYSPKNKRIKNLGKGKIETLLEIIGIAEECIDELEQ